MGFNLDNQSDSGATGASFQDGLFEVVNSGDATKRFKIDLSGATTGTTTYFLFNQTANRNITFFDATDTVVGRATTDILTNKSMSGATNTFTNIPLTTAVTGILPIANGGTNSSAVLNNNRVMVSNTGAIVEASAITASRLLVSDANGIPVAGTATTTEANYLAGVTSLIQNQFTGKTDKSTLSAKGSIYAASGASTPAELVAGADYTQLIYDTSASNGIRAQVMDSFAGIINLGITVVMASNAVTISFVTKAGTNATSTNAILIDFNSATVTSGLYSMIAHTASLSTVISSGSSGGTRASQRSVIWIYAINVSGALEIAWSLVPFKDGIYSTTAEGGAGGADLFYGLYSTTARSNVPMRMVGSFDSTQTTPGTWASAASSVRVGNYATLTQDLKQYCLLSGTGTASINNSRGVLANNTVTTDPFCMSDTTNQRIYPNKRGYWLAMNTVSISSTNVLNNDYLLEIWLSGANAYAGMGTRPAATTPFEYNGQRLVAISTVGTDYIDSRLYGAGNNSVNVLTVAASTLSVAFHSEFY